MSMYYSLNDYRYYELYHHGIKGQKWGRQMGPPYPLDPSSHSAAEKKAGWRKSLDKRGGIIARKVDKVDRVVDTVSDIAKNVKETKGIVNKASELVGHGAARTIIRNKAITEQKLADHSKTKLGKRLHEQKAANASNFAKFHDQRQKDYKKTPVVAYIMDMNPLWDPSFINTKYERLSGRETTVGGKILDTVLTGGLAGAALDARYLYKEHKKSKK